MVYMQQLTQSKCLHCQVQVKQQTLLFSTVAHLRDAAKGHLHVPAAARQQA